MSYQSSVINLKAFVNFDIGLGVVAPCFPQVGFVNLTVAINFI